MENTEGLVELHSFFDALTAGQACNELKDAGIPFEIEDRSVPQKGLNGFQGGPPIWLVVTVRSRDLKAARALLRSTMALFPEREVAESLQPSDDEPEGFIQVVSCEGTTEAEEIRRFLADAGFASEIKVLSDDEGIFAYSVEVQDHNAEKAFAALESWKE